MQNQLTYLIALLPDKTERNLHVMIVSLDGKREATVDLRRIGRIQTSQCTARQHGFLLLIEADGTELFPVAD